MDWCVTKNISKKKFVSKSKLNLDSFCHDIRSRDALELAFATFRAFLAGSKKHIECIT